ncbi:MAG: hypothetical protein JXJ17_06480 [Anaerolineae bacterium]|nr:hypothetical protein [Anaerolineae bacterium]
MGVQFQDEFAVQVVRQTASIFGGWASVRETGFAAGFLSKQYCPMTI